MRYNSKTELLDSIYAERKKLEEKVSSLTSADLAYVGVMGKWSVKDILQHLVDWEQRWIGWYEAGKRGEQVNVPEKGYNWRQLNLLNESYRQKHKDRPLEDVVANFHSSYKQIMEMIEKIPDNEMLTMDVYSWTGKYPLIVYIAGNTCEHYRWAIQVIHPQSIKRKVKAGNSE